jgi:hypothetical protein
LGCIVKNEESENFSEFAEAFDSGCVGACAKHCE